MGHLIVDEDGARKKHMDLDPASFSEAELITLPELDKIIEEEDH